MERRGLGKLAPGSLWGGGDGREWGGRGGEGVGKIGPWIFAETCEALPHIPQREMIAANIIVELFPAKRYRHRRVGPCACRKRRNGGSACAVAQIIDENFPCALCL